MGTWAGSSLSGTEARWTLARPARRPVVHHHPHLPTLRLGDLALLALLLGLVLVMTGTAGLFVTESAYRESASAQVLPSLAVLSGMTSILLGAVAGLVNLGRRAGQIVRSAPPSTGIIVPVTNEDAGESTNAATRPNSSGRP